MKHYGFEEYERADLIAEDNQVGLFPDESSPILTPGSTCRCELAPMGNLGQVCFVACDSGYTFAGCPSSLDWTVESCTINHNPGWHDYCQGTFKKIDGITTIEDLCE